MSDALIVIGVWGEIHFGRKARIAGDVLQEKAKAKVAEANARANKAALELARLKAPGALTDRQIQLMVERLKAFSGQSVTVCASPKR